MNNVVNILNYWGMHRSDKRAEIVATIETLDVASEEAEAAADEIISMNENDTKSENSNLNITFVVLGAASLCAIASISGLVLYRNGKSKAKNEVAEEKIDVAAM